MTERRKLAGGRLVLATHNKGKLREIADETIVPEDLREEYIHSMQKHVEVDEPEATEVPLIQQSGDMTIVNDQADEDSPEMERMTEEDLLRGKVERLRAWKLFVDAGGIKELARLGGMQTPTARDASSTCTTGPRL